MRCLLLPLSCLFVFAISHTQTPGRLPLKEQPKTEEDVIFWNYEVPPYLLVRGRGKNGSSARGSQQYLLQFVQQNLRYPALYRDVHVQGTIVIGFVIGTDGLIDTSTIKSVRDFGADFGDEGIRIVQLMATLGWRWTPGTVRGKAVPVRFYLPIRIRWE